VLKVKEELSLVLKEGSLVIFCFINKTVNTHFCESEGF